MTGKLLGAILGLMMGLVAQSWWGAALLCALGLVAGHLFDRGMEPAQGPSLPKPSTGGAPPEPLELPEPRTKTEVDAEARGRFADHLCLLFAAVARADGDAVRDEVRVVREFFEETLHFSAAELNLVRLSLKRALVAPGNLDDAIRATMEALPAPDRLLLVSALYDLALSDGELRRAERDVIRRIAKGLDVSEAEHASILRIHLPSRTEEYARLGLDPSASDDDVKTAFRKLAALHHPDRVAHLGAGAVEMASRRFREIKQAYDAIRQVRGL